MSPDQFAHHRLRSPVIGRSGFGEEGDYVLDSYQMADAVGRSIRNLIHASGSVEEAENEIKHWFKKDELINYRLIQEQIFYDVNLDGILTYPKTQS